MEKRHDISAYYAPPNTEEHGFYAGPGYDAARRSFSEGVQVLSKRGKKRTHS